MRKIFSIALALATWSIASADDRSLIREAIPLDPNSPDIVGQFHRVGLPKYTEIERQVIDRAQKLQNSHTATFNKIEIGKSVFEYAGLIAMGTIRHDEGAKIPHALTIGIRPHISKFAESFGEYRIEFDANGIIGTRLLQRQGRLGSLFQQMVFDDLPKQICVDPTFHERLEVPWRGLCDQAYQG